MSTTWTTGDVSGSQVLTASDHLYETHVNEIRTAVNALENAFRNAAQYASIQAAINDLPAGGGEVYIPPGTYSITTAIDVPSNVTIRGAGWSTIITMPAATNVNFFELDTVDNVIIQDLQINGSGQTSGVSIGVLIETTNNVTLKNLYIHDCYTAGINSVTTASNYTKIINNYITDCPYGIHSRLVRGLIDGNVVLRSNVDNIYVHSLTDECIVSNNICNDAVTRNGISQDYGSHVIYKGNICQNNAWYGIYTELTLTPSNIEDNICTGNGRDGILVTNVLGATIVGNCCSENNYYGIHVASVGANYSIINSNICEKNKFAGIIIDRTNYIICSNNICRNNSQSAVATYNGILINSSGGVYSTHNLISGNICVDNQNSFTSLLASNANSAQKVVVVADGTQFFEGQWVRISDDTPYIENSQIDTISTNTLTMKTNLINSYTTAQNAVVNGIATQMYGIYETSSSDDYNRIINNECLGNVDGQIYTLGSHTEVSHNRTI